MTDDRMPDAQNTPDSDLPDWLQEVGSEQPHAAAEAVPQRFSAFGITAILIVVGLLAVIGYALYERSKSQPTEGPASLFTVTTFDTDQIAPYNNVRYALEELRGNVAVINFWASYCVPCMDEAPIFERTWQAYKDRGVIFLGIDTDDIDSNAIQFLRDYGVTYPNAPDKGGRVEDLYRISGIPETFIVDRNGEITRHFLAQVSERDLVAEIERALAVEMKAE